MSDAERLDCADPMQIIAALIFLGTKQSLGTSLRLAPLIIEHLDIVQHHRSEVFLPMLRDVCSQLSAHWRVHLATEPCASGAQVTDSNADRGIVLH